MVVHVFVNVLYIHIVYTVNYNYVKQWFLF